MSEPPPPPPKIYISIIYNVRKNSRWTHYIVGVWAGLTLTGALTTLLKRKACNPWPNQYSMPHFFNEPGLCLHNCEFPIIGPLFLHVLKILFPALLITLISSNRTHPNEIAGWSLHIFVILY